MSAQNDISIYRRFRNFGVAGLVVIYLVILAGGVVRMTGSGMGCPDWPKCFGLWIPPTTESQLPPDYQTRYRVAGHDIEPFNVAKTWTEYLNRVIGAVSGLFVFAWVLTGVPLLRKGRAPHLFWLAVATWLVLAFQGWLGARVVFTNLAVSMITIHMLVSMVIVCLQIWTLLATNRFLKTTPTMPNTVWASPRLKWVALFLLVAVVLQVALGSQLRQAVDMVSHHLAAPNRGTWLEQTGTIFYVHRTFSWALVLLTALQTYWMLKAPHLPRKTAFWVAGWVGALVVLGLIMAYGDMPAWAQPLHLLGSLILAGLQFALVRNLWFVPGPKPQPTAVALTT